MAFVTAASRPLAVSAERAFDWLASGDSWNGWTSTFRPASPFAGPIQVGRSVWVRIQGAPVPIRVRFTAVERARELTWTGGLPGLVVAVHRFLFHPEGPDSCRVESIETWSGGLAWLVRPVIAPMAQRIGEAQLAGLPFSSR